MSPSTRLVIRSVLRKTWQDILAAFVIILMIVILGGVLIAGGGANAQNATLAQLGAAGVTEKGGTNAYAHYIVRLGADGKLNPLMLPVGTGGGGAGTVAPFATVAYVDPVTGVDATATGAIGSPYKTIDYAISHFADAVFVLMPGDYPELILPRDPSAYNHVRLYGYGPAHTRIAAITYTDVGGAARPRSLTLSGLSVVGVITHTMLSSFNLILENGATVNTLNVSPVNSNVFVTYGDGAVLRNTTGPIVRTLTQAGELVTYTPAAGEAWPTGAPGTLATAIGKLLEVGTTPADHKLDRVSGTATNLTVTGGLTLIIEDTDVPIVDIATAFGSRLYTVEADTANTNTFTLIYLISVFAP